jgi:hypothetical protein
MKDGVDEIIDVLNDSNYSIVKSYRNRTGKFHLFKNSVEKIQEPYGTRTVSIKDNVSLCGKRDLKNEEGVNIIISSYGNNMIVLRKNMMCQSCHKLIDKDPEKYGLKLAQRSASGYQTYYKKISKKYYG